ncbi:VOC family protein [Myxococcus sp. CA051A]|uniref:VOC family protein n=1 Tax=Myxococcus llanfairpwllgwyngyllgogerychwyrndrobwllllantysiliogogogochensis TaxID=2590453 RepID=A0A540WPZ0_9BACT|nr:MULTISPECIES: VOC family protein [Myxococcus]NTX05905.1 VOC family protein [Myxococcus sp. CA040A]NTX10517.1 VOC family protein [Myxococcus sp. CA056]NTX38152.1 VOC family protein [Myxococcus sp. CA033]NTX53326.1 VOC family protein [Myxococcus sp. CA039A]NTX63305.1 VOC family protein [Myxococcus sp. CA051A]
MQKITPFLMFNNQAEEAAKLYTSVFKNSKITSVARGPDGAAMSVTFELEGQPFMAFNGGPRFKFTEAISLFVSCETQPEVDSLWEQLTAGGGKDSKCGWLEDRFGVSWQIIPTTLMRLMGDKDPAKAGRVVQAMLGMQKIDIAALERAYQGS